MKCKICNGLINAGYLCDSCEQKYSEYLAKLNVKHDWKINDIVYIVKDTNIAGKRLKTICKVRYLGPNGSYYGAIKHFKEYLNGKFYKEVYCDYSHSYKYVNPNEIDEAYIRENIKEDYRGIEKSNTIYSRSSCDVFKTYEECFNRYKSEASDNIINVKKQQVLDIINKKLDSVFTNINIVPDLDDLDEIKLADMIILDSANEVELQKIQKDQVLNAIKEEVQKERNKIESNENEEINKLKQESKNKLDQLIKEYTDDITVQYTKSINNININIKNTTLEYLKSILALNNYYLKLSNIKELKYDINNNDLIVISEDIDN